MSRDTAEHAEKTERTDRVAAVIARADELYHDLTFAAARAWKEKEPGRKVVAYLPVFAPIELITAAGMLPLGVVGGGDQLEIIRGDAFFQSYICHLPRSVVELGVSGRLDFCDGFLFPSTCDVIRNLSGTWQLLFPGKLVRYVDVPQDFSPSLGGKWWKHELTEMRNALGELRGRPITDEEMWASIRLHDRRRALLRQLRDLRATEPWRVPTTEAHLVERAGLVLPPEEHAAMVSEYLAAVRQANRAPRDKARVVIAGAFCEQPPLGLLTTLERAGCYVVDDDTLLGPRFLVESVEPAGGAKGDPIDAQVTALLRHRAASAFLFCEDNDKGRELVETVRRRKADGVIFCAPSFCDPALLDRPMLTRALDEAGISHTSFKYAENTGQFQGIREQAGTFADSLKLWGAA